MFDFSVETPYRRFESKLASNMSMLWRILPHIAIIIAIYIPTLTLQSHTECKFPEHWWGSWFQKGVPDLIHISMFNISEKGTCRRMNGDKYIIENRSDRCVRCLVINERHPNILQYKETYGCYSKNTFDICFDINGDAPLYSLFRVNTSPIKCPFNGPYLFSYSKGINECRDPLSEIGECTDDKRLLLKFKACADVYGSESRVEELECIAEWKESNNKYLVGKLHHSSATSHEDKFRCFVIEKNNSDPIESYNIGQSGDASCDGLFSPRDGLRTFKIRKTNRIEPKCDFPNWLVDNRHWKTLDNRQKYDFSGGKTFIVTNERGDNVERHSKCIESDDISFLYKFNASRFVLHTTLGCKSGFTCLHAYLREERIVELQMGKIVPHFAEACSVQNFNPATTRFTTLTTFDHNTRECYLKGIFSIRSKLAHYGITNHRINNSNYSRLVSFLDSRFICQEKSLRLKSNCDDQDQFQFSCSNDNRVKNLKCRGGWRENNTQWFLVSFIEKFNYEYCISLNMQTNEIKMIPNSHFCFRENHQTFDKSGTLNNQVFGFDQLSNNGVPTPVVSFNLINEGSCRQISGAEMKTLKITWPLLILIMLSSIITTS